MSANTQIEWTDSTWNPVVGCDDVSPGCANCYAKRTIWRLQHNPNPKIAAANAGLTKRMANGRIGWVGGVNCLPERLEIPLHWARQRKIFVNSQSDLFHKDVPGEFIDKVFGIMALTPQHYYQVLTKRPERMAEYAYDPNTKARVYDAAMNPEWGGWDDHVLGGLERFPWPLPNVWLGTSVENQETADERLPFLVETPAAVRFLSCEPLLAPVDVSPWLDRIQWLICGGESGPGARPMNPAWARSLRSQCEQSATTFFHKQNGEFIAAEDVGRSEGLGHYCDYKRSFRGPGEGIAFQRVGKKRAGRLLDGREHNGFPDTVSA